MGKATEELMKKAKSGRASRTLPRVDSSVKRVHKGPVPPPTHVVGTRG